jgi:2-furoyl-CoA dehydrogenase 2Fe-2S iron sulfur subunit
VKRIAADEKTRVAFRLNGRPREGYAEPRMLLADFIRHELGAFGTHVGCEHGVCGACTVSIDGRPARSCLVYAVQVDGTSVTTVEGLSADGNLTALQSAFTRHHALQCGFCTAGILISATLFLEQNPHPTEDEVRHMLSGHICRCTAYNGMVQAILEVSAATAPPGLADAAGHPEGTDRAV